MDWQLENVLLYSARYDRRNLAWVRLDDSRLHFPFLVRDNLAESRDIVLTADAANDVVAAYATSFRWCSIRRRRQGSPTSSRAFRGAAPYVLTLLLPAPARTDDRSGGLHEGTGRAGRQSGAPTRSEGSYEVWAGSHGEAPTLYRSSRSAISTRRPDWRRTLHDPHGFMASRRHVPARWLCPCFAWEKACPHRRTWNQPGLAPTRWLSGDVYYGAGLYTPEARFRIPAPAAHLARNQ